MVAGQVGEITIDIPLNNILMHHTTFTEPVILKVKDVFGLVKMRPKKRYYKEPGNTSSEEVPYDTDHPKWDVDEVKKNFIQHIQGTFDKFEEFMNTKEKFEAEAQLKKKGSSSET